MGISPDGKRIAVEGSVSMTTVNLWDAATCARETPLETGASSPKHLVFASSHTLAVVGDYDTEVWQLEPKRKRLGAFEMEAEFSQAAAIDGVAKRLAIGHEKTIEIRSLPSGKLLHTLRAGRPQYTLAFGKDGVLVALGADRSHAQLWDTNTGAKGTTMVHPTSLRTVTIDPLDNRVLTLDSADTVRIWSGNTMRRAFVAAGAKSAYFALNGRVVVTLHEDGTLRVWRGSKLHPSFNANDVGGVERIDGMHLAHSGKLLAVTSRGNMLALWDLQRGTIVAAGKGSGPTKANSLKAILRQLARQKGQLQFDPAGRLLAVATQGDLQLVDVNRGIVLLRAKDVGKIASLSFHPTKPLLATAGDAVRLWDVRTHRLVTTIATKRFIKEVAFGTADVLVGASLNSDIVKQHHVHWWSLKDGRELRSRPLRNKQGGMAPIIAALAVTPNGKQLVTGHWMKAFDRGAIGIWSMKSGKLQMRLEHPPTVFAVDIDAKGLLATGGYDGTVKLWQLPKGTAVASFRAFRESVAHVAFGGERWLATSGEKDPVVQIWDKTTRKLVVTIVTSDTGEWLVFTPDGYVDASRRGQRLLAWRVGPCLAPGVVGWPERHVPSLLQRVLGGEHSYRLPKLRALASSVSLNAP